MAFLLPGWGIPDADAVHFDGATYLVNDSLVASALTSDLSFFVCVKTVAIGSPVIWECDPDNGGNYVQFRNDGRLRNQMSDVTGGPPSLGVHTLESLRDDQWHTVLFSGRSDLTPNAANTRVFWVDDVAATDFDDLSGSDDPFSQVYNGKPFYIGNDTSGNTLIADMAYLWVAPDVSLLVDGDIPLATRRKFTTVDNKPVFLGDNGELPTGTPPAVFCSGGRSAFPINRGTGGPFSMFGSLRNATTSPND